MTAQKATPFYKILIVLVLIFIVGLAYFFGKYEKSNEKKFRAILLGQTEAEVVRIMGTPDYVVTTPGRDTVDSLGPIKAGEKDFFWLVSPQTAKALGVRIGTDGTVVLLIKEITVRIPR
jgi:hypothetical protein